MTHDHHEHLNLGLQRVDESVVWCVCVCCLFVDAGCLFGCPALQREGRVPLDGTCLLAAWIFQACCCVHFGAANPAVLTTPVLAHKPIPQESRLFPWGHPHMMPGPAGHVVPHLCKTKPCRFYRQSWRGFGARCVDLHLDSELLPCRSLLEGSNASRR
jgi:hypothetical protein